MHTWPHTSNNVNYFCSPRRDLQMAFRWDSEWEAMIWHLGRRVIGNKRSRFSVKMENMFGLSPVIPYLCCQYVFSRSRVSHPVFTQTYWEAETCFKYNPASTFSVAHLIPLQLLCWIQEDPSYATELWLESCGVNNRLGRQTKESRPSQERGWQSIHLGCK